MMRWLRNHFLVAGAAGAAPAIVFVLSGHQIHWPTLVYTLVVLALADIVRDLLR